MTWPIQPPRQTRPRTPWLVRFWQNWKYTTCACVGVVLLSGLLVVFGTPWYKALTPIAVMVVIIGRALWDRWHS